MDMSTAMLTDAAFLLQQDLYRHVERAEYLADEDEWSDEQIELVRELLGELGTTIRHMIGDHGATDTGMCETCERAWPCQVVVTAHRLVKHPQHHFVRLAAMP